MPDTTVYDFHMLLFHHLTPNTTPLELYLAFLIAFLQFL